MEREVWKKLKMNCKNKYIPSRTVSLAVDEGPHVGTI
jgi:hypothetical protein